MKGDTHKGNNAAIYDELSEEKVEIFIQILNQNLSRKNEGDLVKRKKAKLHRKQENEKMKNITP